MFSVLGRLNYTFKNKYVITASFRRDGVSKFSEDNRYGFFPSFAFAWRAGSGKFIQNLDFFSSLKFRAGWGQIGNHGIGPYGTLPNYGASSSLYGTPANGTTVPIVLSNIANPDLTWETTEQLNIGVDFGFNNIKITGTLDVYDKDTKDLLQQTPIPTEVSIETEPDTPGAEAPSKSDIAVEPGSKAKEAQENESSSTSANGKSFTVPGRMKSAKRIYIYVAVCFAALLFGVLMVVSLASKRARYQKGYGNHILKTTFLAWAGGRKCKKKVPMFVIHTPNNRYRYLLVVIRA